jgi:hypothetical protein
MVVKCGRIIPIEDRGIQRVEWTAKDISVVKERVEYQALKLAARAADTEVFDPIAIRQATNAQQAQVVWESVVQETGNIAFRAPEHFNRLLAWVGNTFDARSSYLASVREPLLNVKRLADGLTREAGVYGMMVQQKKFQSALASTARLRGVTLKPDDMMRFLEEGMIPQRMNIYGNTEVQEAALMASYAKFSEDMISRGFTQDDLADLMSYASNVSAQFDNVTAVQAATGMRVGDLYNLGYFPRQFTDQGLVQARLAGIVKWGGEGGDAPTQYAAAIAKSRNTWRYLAEDHKLVAHLLRTTESELATLIDKPVDFALYLSQRVTDGQLDELVDSGLLSKLPLTSTETAEYLVRTYKMPLDLTDLFISDPLQATQRLTSHLKRGVEESAMLKLIQTEGIKAGWVSRRPLEDSWVQMSTITGNNGHIGYLHPMVANQLKAILVTSQNPAHMSNLARAWKAYTGWFAKEAIGNPVGASVYLFNQFMSNALSAMWTGVGPHSYLTSVIDMTRLASQGLEVFDNVKPYRYTSEGPLTHREVVARVARLFSHDVLPGISGDDALFKFQEFNPVYVAKQVAQLNANSLTVKEYAGEIARIAGRKRDAILQPTIRMAAILDMAGHLSVVKGSLRNTALPSSSPLSTLSPLSSPLSGLAEFAQLGRVSSWEEAVTRVKQTFPVFDDVATVPRLISNVLPFSSWAMQNLPLQLRDMRRNPSRWLAYSRIIAVNNLEALEGDTVIRAELSDEDYARYGIILRHDPLTRGTVALYSDNFDPKMGVLGLTFNLAKQLSSEGGNKEGAKNTAIQDFTRRTMARTYVGGIVQALTGIDNFTGKSRDDSSYNTNSVFAGIPMTPLLADILRISPVLSSVDRLEVLSGTRAVEDRRTGDVLIPATQGWLGLEGTKSPNNQRLEGVEAMLQTVGANVRYIDGILNVQYEEGELERTIGDLVSRKRKAQIDLQESIKRKEVEMGSPEYKRRLSAINAMTDATIQINWDLARIQAWAIENRVPSNKMLEEFRRREMTLDRTPLPGAEYIQQMLRQRYDEHILDPSRAD